MTEHHYPISVHLVTHNSSLWLPYCLECLQRQTRQDFFLLVIDNGSLDNSAPLVANFLKAHPALAERSRLVCNKQNLGFARAHNQALAWTDSTYVLLLNPDVLLSENYLAVLVQSLATHHEAAAVTGKLLRWNFDPSSFHLEQLKEPARPNQIDSVGLKIKRSRQVCDMGSSEFDKGQYEVPHQVFGVSGAAPLYRRAWLEEASVQGEVFDEDFVSYKEDVDLAWRLRLGGFTAWYEPRAVAYHDRRLNSDGSLRQRLQARASWPRLLKVYSWTNHLGVLIKNDGWWNLVRDLPWILIHELGKAAYFFVTEPVVFCQAVVRLLKLLPRFMVKRRLLKPTRKLKPSALRAWFTS
ncbi:MAG: glycosyltransferase family 2 protein [Candidatus Kerfeldbacteria bacterium]|nr:glycosyltransferase family 2 protein [Candidatus Kerfeldbacteria bacterium]